MLAQFADPAVDAQRVFRLLLQAMARPGTIASLPVAPAPPPGLTAASAALLLTLVDSDTALWLDPAAAGAAGFFAFHCGCPLPGDHAGADFALIAELAAAPKLASFKQGSEDYPDRSATVLIQVDSLESGAPIALSGPGIRERASLACAGLDQDMIAALRANHAAFPRGVDVIFTCGARFCALPRSTRLEG